MNLVILLVRSNSMQYSAMLLHIAVAKYSAMLLHIAVAKYSAILLHIAIAIPVLSHTSI